MNSQLFQQQNRAAMASINGNSRDRQQAPPSVGSGTPLAKQQQRQGQQQMNQVAQNNMTTAGNRFGDMMTGQPFAAQAAQQREAQARAEANQRAATAHQIQQAGFAGTPLAVMAGNAAESQLRRDRFDNIMGLETERQNMMTQGAQLATSHAGEVNRFEADRLAVDTAAYNAAGLKFNDFLATHPTLVNDLLAAGRDPRLDVAGMIQKNPGLHQALSELHSREGGSGNFDTQWALNKLQNWQTSTNEDDVQIRGLVGLGLDRQDAELIVNKTQLAGLGYAFDPNTNQFVHKDSGHQIARGYGEHRRTAFH
ncbi:MAG: hypothetical protein LBU70_04995 [Chitinispirillales bacterium]|jgi:hypothetical protein|nr:hypothetical protein [Chitinispirillales bacterium]